MTEEPIQATRRSTRGKAKIQEGATDVTDVAKRRAGKGIKRSTKNESETEDMDDDDDDMDDDVDDMDDDDNADDDDNDECPAVLKGCFTNFNFVCLDIELCEM